MKYLKKIERMGEHTAPPPLEFRVALYTFLLTMSSGIQKKLPLPFSLYNMNLKSNTYF